MFNNPRIGTMYVISILDCVAHIQFQKKKMIVLLILL